MATRTLDEIFGNAPAKPSPIFPKRVPVQQAVPAPTAQAKPRSLDEIFGDSSGGKPAAAQASSVQPSASGKRSLDEIFGPPTVVPVARQATDVPMARAAQQPNILDKAADKVNGLYEGYKNLPVIKQGGQIVGGAVAGAGAAAGGAWGALLSPLHQAKVGYQNIKEKGLVQGTIDTVKQAPSILAHDVVDTARSTGGFGYDIGSEGAAAAPLGAAGKLVTVPLSLAQGYTGAKNIKQGIENEDAAQTFEGALQLGTGVFSARSAVKGNGLIVNKSALPGNAARQKAKAVAVYDEVLNQGKGEMRASQKTSLKEYRMSRQSKDILPKLEEPPVPKRDVSTTLVDEGIKIERSKDGKLDTTNGRRQISEGLSSTEARLSSELAKDASKKHSANDLRGRAHSEIDGMKGITAAEKKAMKADIDGLINAEAEARNMSPGKDFKMSDAELHDFKRGVYRLSGDYTKAPGTKEGFRNLANKAKTMIEEKNNSKEVRRLNRIEGELIEADKALENAHGRVVRGGVLGKRIDQLIGASIGGMVGGAPGALAGAEAAGRLTDFRLSPARRTGGALQSLRTPTALEPLKRVPLRYPMSKREEKK